MTEVRPGIHRIEAPIPPRFIAMHLVVGDDGALLFDTGVADSVPGSLVPYLDEIDMLPERIRWVVSSHCDFDHTGGNAAVTGIAPHAELLAGAGDVPLTENVETLIRERYGEFRDTDGFDDPAETTAAVRASTHLVPVDRALRGGETIDLGGRVLDVLHVPGHSDGHLALWDAATRTALISDAVLGDTVPTASGEPAFPPTYRDTQPYLDSIAAIRALDPELLLTAHYPVFEGEEVGDFLDASVAYVERIDAEVEAGLRAAAEPLTTIELIGRIHDRLGPWPAAAADYLVFPVTGNLERMRERGRVHEVRRENGRRAWRWAA